MIVEVVYITGTVKVICQQHTIRGFQTRMVYLNYISCPRYSFLVGNPQHAAVKDDDIDGVYGDHERRQ